MRQYHEHDSGTYLLPELLTLIRTLTSLTPTRALTQADRTPGTSKQPGLVWIHQKDQSSGMPLRTHQSDGRVVSRLWHLASQSALEQNYSVSMSTTVLCMCSRCSCKHSACVSAEGNGITDRLDQSAEQRAGFTLHALSVNLYRTPTGHYGAHVIVTHSLLHASTPRGSVMAGRIEDGDGAAAANVPGLPGSLARRSAQQPGEA